MKIGNFKQYRFKAYNICVILALSIIVSSSCEKKNEQVMSSSKIIKSFVFNDLTPPLSATIDTIAKTIEFTLPSVLTSSVLTPTIIVSEGATITPSSHTTLDFKETQTYTVTAEDGSKAIYVTKLQKPIPAFKETPVAPKYLCIYYAWPSLVNGSNGNTDLAIEVFNKFDIIVFGDGLWKNTHPDNLRTKTIINGLKKQKPSIKIFGYIDVGVITQNLTIQEMQTAIDYWHQMGVDGVFGDDFGFDFSVTRSRQNSFIDYAHSKGLSVFANSWNIDDALGGDDCHLDGSTNDYYLLESFLVGNDLYRSLDEFKQRGDKAYYYMKTKKIGIACCATILYDKLTASTIYDDKYKQSWHGTAMYNFDAFQFTDTQFSASSARLFHFVNLQTDYGLLWTDVDNVRKVSDQRYERSTNTNTFYITGDGSTFGTGGH